MPLVFVSKISGKSRVFLVSEPQNEGVLMKNLLQHIRYLVPDCDGLD
jgi:hypothetical protein